jgi:hypothetical protein
MPDTSGPHLTAALICERVLQEQDGVISVIRVIDRVTLHANAPGDSDFKTFQYPVSVLVTLKSGAARGRGRVTMQLEKPSGEQFPAGEFPVHMEGEERGVNIVINTMFEPDQEGLYWFDVAFNGDRLTRIPLRVMYQPLPAPGHPGG